jgi:hypothetical protein
MVRYRPNFAAGGTFFFTKERSAKLALDPGFRCAHPGYLLPALFVRHVGDRYGIDLVPMFVLDGDEPSLPTAARLGFAVSELVREHHRLLARRRLPGKSMPFGFSRVSRPLVT